PPSDSEVCASAFIASFGARAYRRPLIAAESAGLLDVYRAGALDATYADGIELVLRALLQSAGFLYLTELGDAAPDHNGAIALTGYELASSLSYLITGAPPDAALLEAAAAGALDSAEVRRSELQRLRREPEASEQLVHTLREWLELDRIEVTAKDTAFYPTYEQLGQPFAAESRAFIAAVLDEPAEHSNDLTTLLSADWTVGDQMLGDFYESKALADTHLLLPTRRGILNQGAFLAVHSHAYESSPVLRGAAIARRVACLVVPDPGTLGINVVPPKSDPSLSTRQRFAAHDRDPSCAQCHKTIDSLGNAFEQYDGMGALRESENDVPVDATTTIAVGADFDGVYSDSNALALALAASPSVQECFARYLLRAATARSADSTRAPDVSISEDAFLSEWRALPEAERGNVMDILSAFVSSSLFTHRKASL
ncbi:MAG: hypothetical protein RL701_218, partial [Pseudomonadota bacterium]